MCRVPRFAVALSGLHPSPESSESESLLESSTTAAGFSFAARGRESRGIVVWEARLTVTHRSGSKARFKTDPFKKEQAGD